MEVVPSNVRAWPKAGFGIYRIASELPSAFGRRLLEVECETDTQL
jgi:hypothetical protein